MKYEPRYHVVLYQPEIPHNTGAIGRTCVAVGAKLWLVRPLGFRMDEKTLRRAGLDYWEHLEWEAVDDWNAVVQRLGKRPFWFFTKTATQAYTDARYEEGDVLVFGSETQGLPTALLEANHAKCVKIPMREQARSLNLSNAVAIGLFEAVRQADVVRQ